MLVGGDIREFVPAGMNSAALSGAAGEAAETRLISDLNSSSVKSRRSFASSRGFAESWRMSTSTGYIRVDRYKLFERMASSRWS